MCKTDYSELKKTIFKVDTLPKDDVWISALCRETESLVTDSLQPCLPYRGIVCLGEVLSALESTLREVAIQCTRRSY